MKSKLLIIGIMLLAGILRLYKLGEIPRGLYIDEPSLGFNSYSILKTARDEYGNFLPLAFPAFGEYKLPGYIYFSVPFVYIFGLNAFSVRLLSALSGILAVYGVYLLSRELFKFLQNPKKNLLISLCSALLFAVMPYSINLSRAAFEANFALTLNIFGIYFLLKMMETHSKKYFTLALINLILSFYTYNSSRIIVPLIILSAFIVYNQPFLKKNLKKFSLVQIWNIQLLLLLTFGLLALPGFLGSLVGPESARLRAVFELGNKQYLLGPFLGTLQKYFTHYTAEFLFFFGDFSARHSVHEMGLLLLPMILLIPFGIYALVLINSKSALFLLLWLVIAPLPAALSTPVPHALRSLNILVPLIIFSAFGVLRLYEVRINQIFRTIIFASVLLTISYAFLSYLHIYYRHYAYKTSWDWGEDSTLLAEYISSSYPHFNNKIIIEGNPVNLVYFKFFNAQKNQSFSAKDYIFVSDIGEIDLQPGQLVAVSGWKGASQNIENLKELKMLNNSIGYRVGIWRN